MRYAFIALALLIVPYSGLCGWTAYVAERVRAQPQGHLIDANRILKGRLPQHLLGKYILFRKGTKYYRADLRAWAYVQHLLPDDSFHRWLLERDLLQETEFDNLGSLVAEYPLTPTDRLLPFIKRGLESSHEPVPFLKLLLKMHTPSSRAYLGQWVRNNLSGMQDINVFTLALPQLWVDPPSGVEPTELLEKNWSRMTYYNKSIILEGSYDVLQNSTSIPSTLNAWLSRTLLSDPEARCHGAGGLLGLLLRKGSITISALKSLIITLDSAPIVDGFLSTAEAPDLADLTRDFFVTFLQQGKLEPAVISVDHLVRSEDPNTLSFIQNAVQSVDDSSTKKAVVVELVNNGSKVGLDLIDEAFFGEAPRTYLFKGVEHYAYASQAGLNYQKLAGRQKYIDQGKQWPPASSMQYLTPEYAPLWREFIRRYPWFPGTDDAYYRLAFIYLHARDYSAACETVKAYLAYRPNAPDHDADAYVGGVLRKLVLNNECQLQDPDAAVQLRAIASNTVMAAALGEKVDLSAAADALTWLKQHPEYSFLVSSPSAINWMSEFLAKTRGGDSDSMLNQVLQDHDKVKLDDSALLLLYGWARGLYEADAQDVTFRTIETVKLLLTQQALSSVAEEQQKRLLILADLHFPYYGFDSLISATSERFLRRSLSEALRAIGQHTHVSDPAFETIKLELQTNPGANGN